MSEFERTFKAASTESDCIDPIMDRLVAEIFWCGALKWAKATHDVVSEPRFSCIIKEELLNNQTDNIPKQR